MEQPDDGLSPHHREIVLSIYDRYIAFVSNRHLADFGHGHDHVARVLALRRRLWKDIKSEQPELLVDPFVLELCILFHDLNHSANFVGTNIHARTARYSFIRDVLKISGREEKIYHLVSLIHDVIESSHQADRPDDSPLLVLLRDLDKSDMGATGIIRMAAVGAKRKYEQYWKPRDFNPDVPSVLGDENLDTVAADLRFCLDWWNPTRFAIKTPAIRRAVEHRFKFMQQTLAQLEIEANEVSLFP